MTNHQRRIRETDRQINAIEVPNNTMYALSVEFIHAKRICQKGNSMEDNKEASICNKIF